MSPFLPLRDLARVQLVNGDGLVAEFTPGAGLARLEADGLSLLRCPATAAEPGPANLHLRRHVNDHVEHLALLGAAAPGSMRSDARSLRLRGRWGDLAYTCAFRLAPSGAGWSWELAVANLGDAAVAVDAVLTHDPALTPAEAVRANEFYVSQYLDLSPVRTPRQGVALAVRQNMPGPRSPWMLVGSLSRAVSWATDAGQLIERDWGGARWAGLGRPRLPSTRLQHEHALVALQDAPVVLAPGRTHRTGFYGLLVADHPEATGPADRQWHDHAVTGWNAIREDDAVPDLREDGAVPDLREDGAVPDLREDGAMQGPLFVDLRPFPAARLPATQLGPLAGVDGSDLVETTPGLGPASWTARGRQVVDGVKELQVLRPHGQILRTGADLRPDTDSLTTTVWMAGTFWSQVTRGHVGRDPLLTGRRSYLGWQRGHGLRVFARSEAGSQWQLLEVPSAWRVGPDACTWWYADARGYVLQITSTAPADRHELTLEVTQRGGRSRWLLLALELAGDRGRMLVTPGQDGLVVEPGPGVSGADVTGQEFEGEGYGRTVWQLDWSGTAIRAETGDGRLHPDGQARDPNWVTMLAAPTQQWQLRLTAREQAPQRDPDLRAAPGDSAATDHWASLGAAVTLTAPAGSPLARDVRELDAMLPWFTHDAVVHYLAPRGLEQYSGGGWGTRDVCQGPVGLLTALGRHREFRELLLRVWGAQHERGDWPQAFEFLPPRRSWGEQAHGDVVLWPLLATGDYLLATGDADLLAHPCGFLTSSGPARTAPTDVADHLRRALDRIAATQVDGVCLPAYGHGDWNDSLQPADPVLSERMVSVWTSVLQVQALRSVAAGLSAGGVNSPLVSRARELAARTETALRGVLDELQVLPGYLLLDADGRPEPLVHPGDRHTGLRYGLLPWVHAISAELLRPDEADQHLQLIREHLLGPDGARLFDRPARYVGGPMAVFQRAEASSFFGREIGLMYMHAHLRYAEALARAGQAGALFRAILQACPLGLQRRLGQALPRQTTCYASSSDAVFADRYEAADRYREVIAGRRPVEAGWRIYSSGPGLLLQLVVQSWLGVRVRAGALDLDPVLAPGLDGLWAQVPAGDRRLSVAYHVGPAGCGVRQVRVHGQPVPVEVLPNRYRRGGVTVRLADLDAAAVTATTVGAGPGTCEAPAADAISVEVWTF